jgi:GxxExxY protein
VLHDSVTGTAPCPSVLRCPFRVFTQDEYHQIDRLVTGFAFDIHNEFGRYLDESLYYTELTSRCRQAGLEVEPEMRMAVSLRDFSKVYVADLLINRGVIVETKAAVALTNAHMGQTLNYVFLCGLHHGTLLNFRTERVQHEFVSTRLTHAERRRYEIIDENWRPLTPSCAEMRSLLVELLEEWGAFLDPILYRDALVHFLGGEERVGREIDVFSHSQVIGTHKMPLLADDVAFSVTASTHRPESVLDHQRRFLLHTRLRAIQWINLNHKRIELRTIETQNHGAQNHETQA